MGKLLDNLRKKHATDQQKASRHTVNFLAHKNEIAEAMREGWTVKQIWEQMVEDGMTTMSYASLCRHVKKHISPVMDTVDGAASPSPFSRPIQQPVDSPPKKTKSSVKKHTEKERLDHLKEEAFASVRSRKSTGPLIDRPKSREEENQELFG